MGSHREVKQNFDDYVDDYRRLLAEATGDDPSKIGYYAKQKLRALRRILGDTAGIGAILDYGCGIGLSMPSLREFFPKSSIWGSDPSARSLALAQSEHEKLAINVIDFDRLNSKECEVRFDLIYVSCVLHHIDASEHVRTLSNLRNLARPGGRICIVEHNPRNPVTRKIVRDCPFDEGVTLMRATTLKQRLDQAGWSGIRRRYISFVPASLQALGQVDSLLSWCPVGCQYLILATAQ